MINALEPAWHRNVGRTNVFGEPIVNDSCGQLLRRKIYAMLIDMRLFPS